MKSAKKVTKLPALTVVKKEIFRNLSLCDCDKIQHSHCDFHSLKVEKLCGGRMFLGLLGPDPLVRGTDPGPDLDPSIIKQK